MGQPLRHLDDDLNPANRRSSGGTDLSGETTDDGHEDSGAASRPVLQEIGGGGGEGTTSSRQKEQPSKSLDDDELAQREQSPGSSDDTGEKESEKVDEANDRVGKGFSKRDVAFGLRDRLGNRLNNMSSGKKKLLLGLGIGGGLSSIMLVFILIFMLGALKIPHFLENIVAYQFARTTRQMSQTSQNLTEEKLAIESADDSTYAKIKDRYANASGKVKEQWAKLDKYRPGKIVKNYENDGTFKLEYQKTSSGRLQLKGIALTDKTVVIKPLTGFRQFVPGLQFANNVSLASDVAPSLKAALMADDVGWIVRGKVAKQIRAKLGISLIAWKIGAYNGKTVTEAEITQAREIYKAVTQESTQRAATGSLQDAIDEGKETLDKNVADDGKLQQIIQNGGIDNEVVSVVEKSIDTGGFLKGAVGAINPAYAVAMPICLVYDGSLYSSTDTLDAQSNQVQRAFYYVASAGDQTKDGQPDKEGDQTRSVAVSALANKLGDVSKSNPQQRAQGRDIDTSDYFSTQAGATGDFSIINALFGSSAVANVANDTAQNVCPTLTNVYLGAAIGVANLALCFVPVAGQAACLSEQAAAQGAKTILGRVTTQLLARIISERIAVRISLTSNILTQGIKDTVKVGAATAAATFLARAIVYSKMNMMHNGLNSGIDFQHDVDSGAVIAAQTLNQQQSWGRTLTDAEIAREEGDLKLYAANKLQGDNFNERYFALSKPRSFATLALTRLSSVINVNWFTSLLKTTVGMFSGTGVASLANSFTSGKASAAQYSSKTTYYGNVVFGWTEAERSRLASDPTYKSSLANQEKLDDSGLEDEIIEEYGRCFDGSKTLGQLLKDGDIVRTDDGDIVDKSDIRCSPSNLSFSNPKYGDLVFRVRVAQNYANATDALTDLQEPAPSELAPTSTFNDGALGFAL